MLENNEALVDFADLMHDIEEMKETCLKNNKPILAEKWQRVLSAFNHFTPDDIIEISVLMN